MVTRVSSRTPRPGRRLRTLLASGAAALALTAGAVVPGNPLAPAPSEARADDGKTMLTVAVAQSVDSLSPFLAQRLLEHEHPPAHVRVPDQLRRQGQPRDPGPGHRVGAVGGQADVDVHDPAGLQVVRRRSRPPPRTRPGRSTR